ncbi:MAG: hypothetical protein JJT76_06205 [Clostridiaceae bacterium]|nr:hypothetical protein [Clostridiaceae bacterium]
MIIKLVTVVICLSFLVCTMNYTYATMVNIVNPHEAITYGKMKQYIDELEEKFPILITREVIGKSVDDRDIILVKIGKSDTLIHINGSMHTRERITTNIILQITWKVNIHRIF